GRRAADGRPPPDEPAAHRRRGRAASADRARRVRPSVMLTAEDLRAAGTSVEAIRHHYDISDDFFALWLGPDLVYACALWDADDQDDTLTRAQRRHLDFFADRLGVRDSRVLDVGC